MISLSSSKDQIFEFACHEGNLGMFGILNGARELERKAAERAQAKPARATAKPAGARKGKG